MWAQWIVVSREEGGDLLRGGETGVVVTVGVARERASVVGLTKVGWKELKYCHAEAKKSPRLKGESRGRVDGGEDGERRWESQGRGRCRGERERAGGEGRSGGRPGKIRRKKGPSSRLMGSAPPLAIWRDWYPPKPFRAAWPARLVPVGAVHTGAGRPPDRRHERPTAPNAPKYAPNLTLPGNTRPDFLPAADRFVARRS